ncbi:MAG TPA: hypothetical protein VJN96_18990 [Vicinamibacterales bacterium]|nr:hypothetical protein [Vicinamibacterales bacterium]
MIAPQAPQQPKSFRVSQLPGAYVLYMTNTVGRHRGDRVIADVVISNDSSGSAKVRGRWPAYFSLSPDSTRNGELVIDFDKQSRRLSLMFGDPEGNWTDAGVILIVFMVDRSAIVGRWFDGGLIIDAKSGLVPQGWFCLQRWAS